MSDVLLEFDHVYFDYPESSKFILEDFNLTLKKNKKNAIIGQNGSGKSTILLIADGLYKIKKGNIYWRNNNQENLKYHSKSLRKWRERIGIAFQDPEQQLVAGTVAEDIAYGLVNQELSAQEIKIRLDRAIADFSLQNLANKPLHHLSLGQKRRVALAGVMALQPELLLLDEPTAYLDRKQTDNLLKELERIHKLGTTIAIATHDLDFAYQWADWFIIIHEGKLIMEGEAETVFKHREILEQLELGLPTLWELWEALPLNIRHTKDLVAPRNIEQFKSLIPFLEVSFKDVLS